jgi:hypothetical protein
MAMYSSQPSLVTSAYSASSISCVRAASMETKADPVKSSRASLAAGPLRPAASSAAPSAWPVAAQAVLGHGYAVLDAGIVGGADAFEHLGLRFAVADRVAQHRAAQVVAGFAPLRACGGRNSQRLKPGRSG